MTFAILGTGHTAAFLLHRLSGAGHSCVGIWGRNATATAALAREAVVPILQAPGDVPDGTDLCFLAIADRAIADVAATLRFRQTVLVHCAGSVAASALAAGAEEYGVLWPLYSIRRESLPMHTGFPCAWEAVGRRARRAIPAVAEGISNAPFEASTEQRALLHLAAVMGPNFINHLLGVCGAIVRGAGFSPAVLQPIIQQTVERAATVPDPRTLQTGPAHRADEATMAFHQGLLRDHPTWAAVYTAVSASIRQG